MNVHTSAKASSGMVGQAEQPASVQLRALRKRFKNVDVVKGIDLEIRAGEFVVLVGPSGCGKSTILRMIAGLEDATEGDILIGDREVNEVAAKDRDIAMVFQDYALYPHLTVRRNLSFGLEARKRPAEEIKERIEDASRILGIGDLLDRKPQQLSGGQRQRVAMGRAIVRRPRVFLFDEPLSNLDAKLRGQMRGEMKRLHQTLGATIVYVTHDQVEAMTLADRVVALKDGSIEQQGTPDQLYNTPANLFVAGFIGAPSMNFIPCECRTHEGGSCLQISSGPSLLLPGPPPPDRVRHGQQLILGLRPETLAIAEGAQPAPSQTIVKGVINLVEPLGSDTVVTLTVAGLDVVARLPPMHGLTPGAELPLLIDLSRMHLFDAQTGQALTGGGPLQ